MYLKFKIENFRCFKSFEIDELDRIALITGVNNVGKTALLEAFWLHLGGNNATLGVNIEGKRGIHEFNVKEFLWDLFKDFDSDKSIRLVSTDSEGKERATLIRKEQPSVSKVPVNGNGDSGLGDDESSPGTEALSPEYIFEYIDEQEYSYETRMSFVKDLKEDKQVLQIKGNKVQGLPQGIYLLLQDPIRKKMPRDLEA